MKPLILIEADGHKSCDVVGAPSHEDCLSLGRYFEKYWQASVEEIFDTGFAARFKVVMPDRYFILSHDSQAGNYLISPNNDIDAIIPDILSDLSNRLMQD